MTDSVGNSASASDNTKEANAYFTPKFAEKLLVRYLSILPLWTCVGLPTDQKRLSNGVVESWFNITKTRALHSKPANSIADFERSIRPSVVGRLKHNLGRISQYARRPTHRHQVDLDSEVSA